LCAFGAGAVPSAVVRESMTLFAREVMPAFARTDDRRNSMSALAQEP
jgi:hypothetical protein